MKTSELRRQIGRKKLELEIAQQANKPTAVVVKLYKELKALQFELIVTEVKEKHSTLTLKT